MNNFSLLQARNLVFTVLSAGMMRSHLCMDVQSLGPKWHNKSKKIGSDKLLLLYKRGNSIGAFIDDVFNA
ncbi:hypothetical protein VNO78_10456 [Psophocarpus tetragonolobus]|uniref:Uncharacterized protein n=1 Tax=Psophocarpus tetragonolobus TaxID=3891 RepID=A0AAN9SME1_PSOTE